MNQQMYKFILESTLNNKIEQETAISMLKMLKQHESLPALNSRDVAIVGLAINVPGATSKEQFWCNLCSNEDNLSRVPETRHRDIESYLESQGIEHIEYMEGGFLKEIDKFDSHFFNILPNEAKFIDPNQRLFLETAWEAIEDAGYGEKRILPSNTGVYIGFSGDILYDKLVESADPTFWTAKTLENVSSMIAGRLSYVLNLNGPSALINTACSSSLTAVHIACQALNNGEIESAIVGSVKVNLLPIKRKVESGLDIDIASSDGKNRSFDDHSSGTVGGEGVGAIMLKPLHKAKQDKDHIYAVIKGSAVNQDGKSVGITAPNVAAQEQVIVNAWKNAGIEPETISYIEAHGTGTRLGDPIEIEGISRAFRRFTNKRQFCAVSSVKSNIGHLDNAAGLVGLIKAVLSLERRVLLPSVNFKKPNRIIPFHKSPVYINDEVKAWVSDDSHTPLRCGVSAFSISGTNCHLVLEQAPIVEADKPNEQQRHPFLLKMSAKNRNTLFKLAGRYYEYISFVDPIELVQLCYTANLGREDYSHRLAFMFTSKDELLSMLYSAMNGQVDGILGMQYGFHKVFAVKDNYQENELSLEAVDELSNRANALLETIRNIQDNTIDHSEINRIVRAFIELYVKGADANWSLYYGNQSYPKLALPTYPFERTRCWFELPKRVTENDSGFYQTYWEVTEDIPVSDITIASTALIFKGQGRIASDLVQSLRKLGVQMIEVEYGNSFERNDPHSYVIKGGKEDYERVFSSIDSREVTHIIHLSAVNERTSIKDVSQLKEIQDRGERGLFHMLQSLNRVEHHPKLKFILIADFVSNVTQDEVSYKPENAPLFGLGKVIPLENPEMSCICIDIDAHTPAAKIINEIFVPIVPENRHIAYRKGKRYREVLDLLNVSLIQDQPLRYVDEGVYIITGGLGGIGLEIGRYLSRQMNGHLILCSRTPFPDRSEWDTLLLHNKEGRLREQINKINKIEKAGTVVHIYSVDVANEDQIRNMLSQARKLGVIRGIFHCAGVAGNGFIVNKRVESFDEVIAPKVVGTWLLHHLTAEDSVDFMVLCSGGSIFGGDPGQGDYCAANSYLDAFTAYRNKMGKRTLTINWGTWREVGLAVHNQINMDAFYKALPTDKAIRLLEIALNKRLTRVCIADIDVKFAASIFKSGQLSQINLSGLLTQQLSKVQIDTGNVSVDKVTRDVQITGKESKELTRMEILVAAAWADVFGLDSVDVYDNFFEIGGDSIVALKLVNKFRQYPETQNSRVIDIISFPVLSRLAENLENRSQLTQPMETTKIRRVPTRRSYETSSSQKRLFIIGEMEETGTSYNVSLVLKIKGKLNYTRLTRAMEQLVQRHESLRTSFEFLGDQLVQFVHQSVEYQIEYIDLKDDIDNADQHVGRFIKSFKLRETPLFRVGLIELSQDQHIFILDMHHVISDGTSLSLLGRDLIAFYNKSSLPELPIQYKDYAAWQNLRIASNQIKNSEEYWLSVFGGDLPLLQLPTDYPRPSVKDFMGDKITFVIDKNTTARLQESCVQTGTTMYMFLLSIFNVLLYKYSKQEDIIVGTPTIGRFTDEISDVVGMFVNALAIRNNPKGGLTFVEFLDQVKSNVLDAFEHQEYPFMELLGKLKLSGDVARNPLFDVSFIYQNIPSASVAEVDGLIFEPYPYKSLTARNDILIEACMDQDQLNVFIEYRTSLYKIETIQMMVEHYFLIINQVLENRQIRLSEISLYEKESREILIEDFNSSLE